jgi:hypothetical protein
MAASEQMAKDFGESAQNVLIVVLTDNRGLQPADGDAYHKVAATLRGDTNDVTGVQDVLTTPALRPMMVSADNKASYMAVMLRAPAGSLVLAGLPTDHRHRQTHHRGLPADRERDRTGRHGRRHVDRHRAIWTTSR